MSLNVLNLMSKLVDGMKYIEQWMKVWILAASAFLEGIS